MTTIPGLIDYTDPRFIDEEYLFYIVDNDVCSINNMDDRQLRESIVNDILTVTMWEIDNKKKVHYGMTKFLQFIRREKQKRVMDMMKHPEIEFMIHLVRTEGGSEIRIKDDRNIRQAAMDYCGHWYEGYTIPEGMDIISLNFEKFEEEVEKYGSVENLAASLAMDVRAAMQGATIHDLPTKPQ